MKNQSAATDTEIQTEDLESNFRSRLRDFSKFAADHGLQIEPYSELTWPKFRSLSGSMQRDAFGKFSGYFDLCIAAAKSGIQLGDDRALAWWAVQKFNLRPCSDFFDKLTTDHIVEIYNRDFVQIYRNWAFFQISSYTMGDLFVYPWPDLYVRDEAVTQNLVVNASKVLDGSTKHTVAIPNPRHIVVESLSAGKNILEMSVDWASPLFDPNGETVAMFAVSSVRKIGKQDVRETKRNEPVSILALSSAGL